MGRSTKGKINKTSVNTANIRDILNSDRSSLPRRMRASEFFIDAANNDIYNNFIDPEYCAPGEGETSKDKLTRQPYKWGNFRNYGGSEYDITTGIPLIYWKEVVDANNYNHTPESGDALDYLVQNKLYPNITVSPKLNEIRNYRDSTTDANLNLAGGIQSVMFRTTGENALNDSLLGTRVGIDYPDGYTGSAPEFKIKVTPYLKNVSIPLMYEKEINDWITGLPITLTLGDMSIPAGFTTVGVFLAALGGGDIAQGGSILWDYLTGTLIPKLTSAGIDINMFEGIQGFLAGILESATAAVLLQVMQAIAIGVAVVLVADIVWDILTPIADIQDILYQYQNVVLGIYNFTDIMSSSYSFLAANKRVITNGENHLIKQEGKEHIYSVNDLNFGDPFSDSNLITSWPNSGTVNTKYWNVQFFPKAVQFDYFTPPPVINYLVELIPVSNCEAHPDKLTLFSVQMMPDKFLAPDFRVEVPGQNQGIKDVYRNTPITLKNARFVDYIFCKDTNRSGLFTSYQNICVNTAANKNRNESITEKVIPYSGNDIAVDGNTLFGNVESDRYEIEFMMEKQSNMIFNPYFRVEKDDLTARRFVDLRKFWQYSTDWKIRTGGIYRDSARVGISYFSQLLSPDRLRASDVTGASKTRYYYTLTLTIEKSAGSLLLGTNTFRKGVYKTTWDSNNQRNIYSSGELANLGMSLGDNSINFNESGTYKVILESLPHPGYTLTFVPTFDFVGRITECRLQYLPLSSAGDSNKRGSGNAITKFIQPRQQVNFYNQTLNTKTLRLKYNEIPTKNISFTLKIKDAIYGGEQLYQKLKIDLRFFKNSDGKLIDGQYFDLNWYDEGMPSIEETYTTFISSNIYFVDVIFTTPSGYVISEVIDSFTVTNDNKFKGFQDYNGLLFNSNVNVSSTNFAGLNSFRYKLNSLDVSNTLTSEDIATLVNVTGGINVSNSNIYGDFGNLINIITVIADNCKISNFGGVNTVSYSDSIIPNIVWKNSGINSQSLNNLILRLDESTNENGNLDIAGDNPEITNELVLQAITNLVNKGWNVLYNAKSVPVITLVGGNPLTIEVGDPYVELGATAEDGKDGDITADIVIDAAAVNVNTVGSYSVTYNVTDSDGNAAEEVVRVVNVIEAEEWTYEGAMTVGFSIDHNVYGYVYYPSTELYVGDITPALGLPHDGGIFYVVGFTTVIESLNVNTSSTTLPFDENANITLIYINGEIYDVYWDGYNWVLDYSENPFPPVGETCEIKLRYTLAPEPTYPEVTIGTQTWMAVNLDIDDGLGGIYAYDDNEANVATYGRLYTWDAAVRIAASIDGWHLPSDAEWTTLTTYLGGEAVAGGKLKETGTTHWASPNTGATNESGFTALPGGSRASYGTFFNIGLVGIWRSATENDATSAWTHYVYYNSSIVGRTNYSKESAYSVRLIKNTP